MAVMQTVKKMKEMSGSTRLSASPQEVEFSFYAPAARKVIIAGTFNNWNTSALQMKRDKDGTWKIKLKLQPGQYEYKYLADGTWVQEMGNADKAPNSFGSYNRVIGIKAA